MKKFRRFLIVVLALAAFALVVQEKHRPLPVALEHQKIGELQRIAQACPWQLAPPSAEAADKIQVALTSTDAGQTNVFCFANTNQPVKLETQTSDPFCYQTCATSTCAINTDAGTGVITPCISAFRPPIPLVGVNSTDGGLYAQVPYTYNVDMAQDKCITAFSVDAGNPKLNIYLITRTNPNAGPSF